MANAFVSDYALDQTKRIAQQNLQQIRSQGIPLRISIGDRDEFALNMGRKASPVIHQYLNNLQIAHDYEVFPGSKSWIRQSLEYQTEKWFAEWFG